MILAVEHEPVWTPATDILSTATPDRIEVCVIGAGIAGLSTAYCLAKAGKRVLVLDDGKVGNGQSFCTTAHLSNVIDDRFESLEKTRGKEAAKLAAGSHAAAIDFIEATARDEGIECDFQRVDGYLFAPSADEAKSIDGEERAAREAGLDVERMANFPIEGVHTGPCLRFANQARFEPMRYLQGLAAAVIAHGGSIQTGKHVKRLQSGKVIALETQNGQVFLADNVVVATNSPINGQLTLLAKMAPYITYVVALEAPRHTLPDDLFWDTEDPYHYARTAKRDSDSEWLIVGGEDHRTGQADDHEMRFAKLERWARDHFPGVGTVHHRWAGQVMETADGLAFIGPNPGDGENVFIATGDSGMGMTHGTIAGMLLSDLILGRTNPWKDLYSPSRNVARSMGTYLSENLNSVWQYTNWLTGGDVSTEASIQPNSGAVIRQGMRKIAVYRDEEGEFHRCSAMCPHAKAVVQWNDAEKTWDCPAHGSRFDCGGKVIQGPANADLSTE